MIKENVLMTTDLGDTLKLDYFLTEMEGSANKIYGICIEKSNKDQKASSFIESKMVQAISHSKNMVEKMINVLVRNQVTPLALEEIVDDMITIESMGELR